MLFEKSILPEDQPSIINKKAAALYKEQQERGERSALLRKALIEITKEETENTEQTYGVYDNGLLYLSYPLK